MYQIVLSTIIWNLSGKSHGKLGKHHYFLSWREPWNKFEDWDWFNARNFCRERCMDLVSFETAHEFQMFKEVMIAGTANCSMPHVELTRNCNNYHL